ncbi:MAG: GNAT family N-acetyltransferase [Lachnospiraceae bacterium]|nr:GNAT family N-acetyltransferase [uncultured Acetatifactor sp.]MCI9571578.1 GNAT family N-acetyltransferase [Lachnospiraceae bacterium]
MKLIKIGIDDAEKLWKMQIEAFYDLYEKYQDAETSPATEKIDKIIMRLNQSFTYYYFIEANGIIVGAVRVVDRQEEGMAKRISPVFIMKEYRNKGYAQKAIQLVEEIHGSSNWELNTILQEKGNCYLYEKMGYHQTGKTETINNKLTLVFYRK